MICLWVCVLAALVRSHPDIDSKSSSYLVPKESTTNFYSVQNAMQQHHQTDMKDLEGTAAFNEIGFWGLYKLNMSTPDTLHPDIPVLVTNSLVFENRLLNTSQRIFWDMFIRDLSFFVFIPRFGSSTIDVTKIQFYFPEINKRFHLNVVDYRAFPWMKVEPEDVAIGIIQEPKLARYIKFLRNRQINRLIDVEVSVPILGNLTQSFKMQSYSHLASIVRRYQLDIVATVPVKLSTSIPDLHNWITYHKSIGVEHFILFFFRQLRKESSEYIHQINQLAINCNFCFSIAQWHPYRVSGPHPYKGYVSSYVGYLFSVLYRLKAPVPQPGVKRLHRPDGFVGFNESELRVPHRDSYLAVLDVNDFLVVHTEFSNIRDMVLQYPFATTSAISFPVNYFYMVDKQTHRPMNLSTLDHPTFINNYILHESDAKDIQTTVSRMVYNTRNTIFIASNGNLQMARLTSVLHSPSFCLHFLRSANCQRTCELKYPSRPKSISHFMKLPRSYNASNDCPMYDGTNGPKDCITSMTMIQDNFSEY